MNKKISILISFGVVIAFLLLLFNYQDNNSELVIDNSQKTEENNQNNMQQENKENDQVVKVNIQTSEGNISLEMYPKEAPKTVENFVKLSEQGFYNDTKFHRVIKEFMIQGGDPLSKDESSRQFWGTGGPGYQFEDEQNNVSLEKGVIAMANSGPNTNGSQFFIITAESTPWLQGKHTGFGKVVAGMEVVEKIENTEVGATDQPTSDITLISVEIEK